MADYWHNGLSHKVTTGHLGNLLLKGTEGDSLVKAWLAFQGELIHMLSKQRSPFSLHGSPMYTINAITSRDSKVTQNRSHSRRCSTVFHQWQELISTRNNLVCCCCCCLHKTWYFLAASHVHIFPWFPKRQWCCVTSLHTTCVLQDSGSALWFLNYFDIILWVLLGSSCPVSV